MNTQAAKGVALICFALVVSAFHCGGEVKDSEVRTYIHNELAPFLDTLAHELCRVRAAQKKAGVGFCDDETKPGQVDNPETTVVEDSTTDPDTYKKPGTNGNP